MNVYNLGIICCGFPLVANSISPKYGPTQVEVMPGIYVMKHSNTMMKKGSWIESLTLWGWDGK